MYCIKCGAELSDGQTVCPICKTRVYHPDFPVEEKNTYPKDNFLPEEYNRRGIMFVITILFLIPLILPVALELSWHESIIWSGYVSGGTLLAYIMFVLPCWFRHPNPVIFVPGSFAAITLFLLYVNFATGGGWFMSFAFPLSGGMGAIASAMAALMRYIKRGRLYMFGGCSIAFGLWTVLLEFLIRYSFGISTPFYWSLATLTVFFILGMMLIVIAIVKPFKESLRRIFFIGKL